MTAAPSAPAAKAQRLPALDWLRGFVIALMVVDHADALGNPRHQSTDGSLLPQEALRTADFLTRWCTHLCAPTFVFLAGTAMALSAARRAAGVDRHLLARGAVLIGLEVTVMSFFWRQGIPGLGVMLQVLYALGAGMMAMAVLRRLSTRGLVLAAVGLALGCEVAFALLAPTAERQPGLVLRLLVSGGWGGGFDDWPPGLLVMYPALPWLPPMLLGHAFGRHLARPDGTPIRLLLLAGAIGLLVFAALRLGNGFGNMLLPRQDGSLLEWLHCSKYPPSLTFLGMELGLMALLLALLLAVQRRLGGRLEHWNPLLVVGQVPLFFYLVHLPLLGLLAHLGVLPMGGAGRSWLAALVVLVLLTPLCGLYRWYKQACRHRWTRYL